MVEYENVKDTLKQLVRLNEPGTTFGKVSTIVDNGIKTDKREFTIKDLQEFAKKYAKPHGSAWVKRNILYPFKPDWCSNIHPGRGGKMTIFEYPAAIWMNGIERR